MTDPISLSVFQTLVFQLIQFFKKSKIPVNYFFVTISIIFIGIGYFYEYYFPLYALPFVIILSFGIEKKSSYKGSLIFHELVECIHSLNKNEIYKNQEDVRMLKNRLDHLLYIILEHTCQMVKRGCAKENARARGYVLILENGIFKIHSWHGFSSYIGNINLIYDENAADFIRKTFLRGKREFLNNTKGMEIYTPCKDMQINSIGAIPLVADDEYKFGILILECDHKEAFSNFAQEALHGISHIITCTVAHYYKRICPNGILLSSKFSDQIGVVIP